MFDSIDNKQYLMINRTTQKSDSGFTPRDHYLETVGLNPDVQKSDSGFTPRDHYLATVGLNPADHHYTQRSLFRNCGSEPSSVYIVF